MKLLKSKIQSWFKCIYEKERDPIICFKN